jgi:disulfide bond formation protein DsbB
VKQGRPANDPANTTGITMPPKGGFEFLTDEDILKIIAFVRSIHE